MANDLLNNSMKETKLGLLPSEWDVLPVSQFGSVVTGSTPSTKERRYYDGPYPFISPGDISNRTYVMRAAKTITAEGLAVCRPLPFNSVMVVCIGATIGKTALTSHEKSATNQQINALITSDRFDPVFACYALKHRSSVLPSLAGRAAIPIVNKSVFSEFLLPVPPFAEQKAIAHVLRTVQRAKEVTEKVIAAARQLKQSLMRHLFTYGSVPVNQSDKVPLKETEIGQVPEHWKMLSLGGAICKGPQNGVYKAKTDYGSGTPIVRIDDFDNDGSIVETVPNRVRLSDAEISTYGLAPNDLLLNRVNSLSHLGKTALVGAIREAIVFESNMMRFGVEASVFRPKYIFHCLNLPQSRNYLRSKAKRAVAQSSVNQEDVKSIPFSLPSIEEQDLVVDMLAGADRKVKTEVDRKQALDALFKSLLHHLMTGKVRVNELEFPARTEGSP